MGGSAEGGLTQSLAMKGSWLALIDGSGHRGDGFWRETWHMRLARG
jgi:hypothetical protein